MDFRLLARGLRARPTPWLQQQTQLHPLASLANAMRYNSSYSSPSGPLKPTTPTDQPSTVPEAEQPVPDAEAAPQAPTAISDFDDILNKLDLNKARAPPSSHRRVFSDALSRAVGSGSQGGIRARLRAIPPARKVELKLGPTLGRQAHVEPGRGTDLAAALRKLHTTIVQNKIKQEANAQRFHTRKGMVRKVKKMQRWKKLFKFSFQGTVQKIQRMQAQGW
ncbi:hypothetical protein N7535_004851 [Penicillium sp. DV-2018c]|nr:hypothetical protein N7535_004851 [Penicillium sp. DV-2018c]